MISIFNRKELLITYDMKKQSEVRTILKNNEIEYKVKNILSPTPLNSGSRVHMGSVGIDLSKAYFTIDTSNRKYNGNRADCWMGCQAVRRICAK